MQIRMPPRTHLKYVPSGGEGHERGRGGQRKGERLRDEAAARNERAAGTPTGTGACAQSR